MEKPAHCGGRRSASLTQERLKKLFIYNPETGEFWRRSKYRGKGERKKAGYLVGGPNGYHKIYIDGKYHMCHRLVWMYVFGRWPAHCLDHINRNRLDNRLCNLREATVSQNGANMNLMSRSKSGIKGVFRRGNSWRVTVRGKVIGSFSSPEEAIAAHKKEHVRVYGEFSSEATSAAVSD